MGSPSDFFFYEMEEMVAEFLSFFLFVSYFCLRNECKTYEYKTKKMKKRIRSAGFPRIFTIFAKNTAHNEITISYYTTVEGKVGQ